MYSAYVNSDTIVKKQTLAQPQRKVASSASRLSDLAAAKVRFGSGLRSRQAMTAFAAWAAPQQKTCCGRKAMLRRRGGKIQGRLCPDSVEKVGFGSADWRSPNQLDRSSQPVGSGCGTSFASFLRFCAVAASWNCSYAPLGPRSRIIGTPM